jgi:iron complex transport system substrate-binding protein
MALKPDGVVISLYEGMNVPDLSSAGVKYIKFADNLETTPLGRAEWLKFIGLLTNKETEADSIFNVVKDRYLHLKNSVSEKTHRPKVMVETMYEGIWYVPGGNSFQANMLADAGANYPWSDDKSTGSLSLSYEEVLNRCENADFWIVKVYDKNLTKSSLSELDNRYSRFKTFRNGNIYYSDTSKSQLFEEFPFHPDLLLEDYIKILHSGNNKVDNLRYFNKIGD